MVSILGPEPDTGSVIEPESRPLGLFMGHFEPLTAPDPFHALVVHLPAVVPEQDRDPAITLTTIVRRQVEDGPRQWPPVLSLDQGSAPGRARLTDHPAGSPL